MHYDLFISYSRKDNSNNRVTELKEKIESEYLEFAKEELKCFFDKEEIKGMDDWKQRLLQGLKSSDLLLLILSPNYLDSPYCEWEIVEYLKYEYARATQGEGVAQIYFMEIPGLDEPGFKEKATVWVEKISQRQRFDFREWYNEGSDSLKRTDVKNRLDELKRSLQLRIARMRRIVNTPGNLPAPNARFVGREREMKLLHESVGLGKFGVLTAVHGMGGLGKTSIAFQYAYTYADFYPGGRWQIGCANETNLAAVLKKLDLDLKITFTEDEKKDDIRGAKRIINELETLAIKGAEARIGEKNPPGPAVLLLLDNVDNAELIQPPNSELISGIDWLKVLVTTRMGPEELGEDETKQTLLSVDELPLDDALSLIESYQPKGRFKDENEREKAVEIVKLLGGFTLAVEVAALYLFEKKGRVSCADFFEVLKCKGIDFVGENTNKQLSHTKLISVSLAPTLDSLSPEEALILSYASLLPTDSIPLPWLKTLVVKEYPYLGQEEMPGIDNPWISNVNHLLSLRLFQVAELDEEGKNPQIVRMHRLVSELVHSKCISPDKNNQIKIGQQGPTRSEELLQKLIAHSISRAIKLKSDWVTPGTRWEINPLRDLSWKLLRENRLDGAQLAVWVEHPLGSLSRYSEGKTLLKFAISVRENLLPPNDPQLATIYGNLGYTEHLSGNDLEAKKYLEIAINIDGNQPGNNELSMANHYSLLGEVMNTLGDVEAAVQLTKKCLLIEERLLPENNENITTRYSNLCTYETILGNFEDAQKYGRKALALTNESDKSTHPDMALFYNSLGMVEQKMGNLDEAEKLLRRSLDFRLAIYGEEHPATANGMVNLGQVLLDSGDIVEAEKFACRALNIWQQCETKNDWRQGKAERILSIASSKRGDFVGARFHLVKALDLFLLGLTENHPLVIDVKKEIKLLT
jgi:tetratricopeptide (TPR) repeat protein